MRNLSFLSANNEYKNENIHFYMVECDKNMTKSCMHYFLNFHYIMRLIPFNLLEVKWLNSHIFMSYVDPRLR